MICQIKPFDKSCDLQEVDQFGYLNLAQAYANGVVSGDLNPDQSSMNNIEEPGSIIGKPSDEFDAVRLHEIVRERGVKAPQDSDSGDSGGSGDSE